MKLPILILALVCALGSMAGWLISKPLTETFIAANQYNKELPAMYIGIAIILVLTIIASITAHFCKEKEPRLWAGATFISLLVTFMFMVNTALLAEGYQDIWSTISSSGLIVLFCVICFKPWKEFIHLWFPPKSE